MKIKHVAMWVGGYFVAAYIYNQYINASGTFPFAAPFDVLSSVLPNS